MARIDISVITPCFNEERTVRECAEVLKKIMKERLPSLNYEHIFADNASTDKTVQILRDLARRDSRIKVIVNSRNIGASRNIYRALFRASGSTIVPMLPADLQDPAEVIPDFYSHWLEGSLVVYGQRTNRQESFLLRSLRSLYYKVIAKFSEARIPLNSGEFMLIDKKVAESIMELDEKNPYVRGLVAQTAVPSSYVPYVWVKRKFGESKSTPLVLIDTAINGLVSTSRLPARFALLFGFLFSAIGILLAIYTLLATLIQGSNSQNGIPTVVTAIFFMGGVQLFFLGLIGEYVLSIHGATRPEPTAFDIEVINF